MNDFPRYITRYFKKDDREHFEEGSLKFGNTAEYRAAEEHMSLESRGDEKEGLTERHGLLPKDIESMTEADFNALGQYRSSLPPNISVGGSYYTEAINAWVFCSSLGGYSAKHHKRMRYGDPETGYAGNESLDSWCVFDTHRLLRALKFALRQHPKFRRHDYWSKTLYWRAVSYDWNPRQFTSAREEFEALTQGPKPLTDDEVVKRLTTKRSLFGTEKEFRIVARIDERSCLPENESALFVQSHRIRNSIVDFGSCQ
jgi:hypothetical protein